MGENFSKTYIRDLPPPGKANKIYYDDQVHGFGIRVTAGGAKSFVLNYRTQSGRERRITIGGFGDWAVEAARKEARRLRQIVDQGGDPLGDIEALRAAPTMSELCDRFIAEHVSRKRAGTQVDYKSIIEKHVRPFFFGKHTKAADVSFQDVDRLHRKITGDGHARRANTTVAVLSKMFSLAVRWGMRPDNPCKGIERNVETSRRRYLKGGEMQALIAALTEYPNQQIANVFRLLLMTGARRGEVLSARWAEIDLTTGIWAKLASSTKQNEPHEAPLSAPARQLLSEICQAQIAKTRVLGEFVFPGAGKSAHIVEVKKAWRTVTKTADINGLRIHDLRHCFASELVSSGASLALIGSLLGHASPQTTSRYAHMFQDAQRAAVEKVGAIIVNAGKTETAAEIVPLPKRGRRP